MEYRLRFAAPEDFEKIHALKCACVKPYVQPIWGWEEGWQRRELEGDFQNIRQFYVIEAEGEFAGFLQYSSEYPVLFHIHELHLLPQYRGRGIGTDILEQCKRVCIAQHRTAEIGCFQANTRARALYERLGFEVREETQTHYILQYPGWRVVPYDERYRDDLIFMVLSAKDALGRLPRLNGDLLNIRGEYLDRGDAFWLALDKNDRVIGSIGYRSIPDTTEVRLHRLYIKPNLKRRGIGTWLLHTAEMHLRRQKKTAAWVHLGGREYYESRSFYPRHGYQPAGEEMLRKELSPWEEEP